eukprot:GFKZ01000923.1.p2 GENE.GFKZ01000923.1~~GFKZ01000923.1.p2  ORF type:complete len:113 (-),score=6.48 GFKZ01000923.1:653-991(-)
MAKETTSWRTMPFPKKLSLSTWLNGNCDSNNAQFVGIPSRLRDMVTHRFAIRLFHQYAHNSSVPRRKHNSSESRSVTHRIIRIIPCCGSLTRLSAESEQTRQLVRNWIMSSS